ncbi:MAG: hypothetical protein RLZZ273_648 [Bacteroidota bacterium]|jgi:signal peptidase II
MHTSRWYFAIATGLIILDQLLKFLVKGGTIMGLHQDGMYIGESFPLIGEAVRITFVENPGMAFGISWGSAKIVLTLLTIVIASALAYVVHTRTDSTKLERTSFMLIFAGAVGNLIDRMFYGVFYDEAPLFEGRVVDFLQIDIPDVTWLGVEYTHFPVFNLADSCVSIGVVLMIIASFLVKPAELPAKSDL